MPQTTPDPADALTGAALSDAALSDAAAAVRRAWPQATTMTLTTSVNNDSGFLLSSVHDDAGVSLEDVDPPAFLTAEAEVCDALYELPWRGPLAVDWAPGQLYGTAEVPLQP